jgi:hypothetical protein
MRPRALTLFVAALWLAAAPAGATGTEARLDPHEREMMPGDLHVDDTSPIEEAFYFHKLHKRERTDRIKHEMREDAKRDGEKRREREKSRD